jgi:hypothetical protein
MSAPNPWRLRPAAPSAAQWECPAGAAARGWCPARHRVGATGAAGPQPSLPRPGPLPAGRFRAMAGIRRWTHHHSLGP